MHNEEEEEEEKEEEEEETEEEEEVEAAAAVVVVVVVVVYCSPSLCTQAPHMAMPELQMFEIKHPSTSPYLFAI